VATTSQALTCDYVIGAHNNYFPGKESDLGVDSGTHGFAAYERDSGSGVIGNLMARGSESRPGFTLLEMMLVIAIIGILAAMSVPRYRRYVTRAREAVFQENLFMLRATIERFTLDQKRPPTSLQELVSQGYLAQLPKDITGSADTWVVEYSDLSFDPEGRPGIK